MLGGTFFPPRKRRRARERPASHRQRVVKSGEGSTACSRTCRTELGWRKWKTSANGKLCCSLSEMFSPLSVAAACSSKLNERQKRLRSARPQALLMRAPNGAWMMSCMPPLSSKKRCDHGGLRGNRPQQCAASHHVFHGLFGAGLIEAAFEFEPVHG